MSTDHEIKAKFDAFRAATQPTLSGPGGPQARADVQRHRRRNQATGVIALVLVVVATVAVVVSRRPAEDRLVPATPPSPSASRQVASPSGAYDNATLDLRPIPANQCGGVVVKLKDNQDFVDKPTSNGLSSPYTFSVVAALPLFTDLNQDAVRDRLVVVSCVGEGGGVATEWPILFSGKMPFLTAFRALPKPYTGGSMVVTDTASKTPEFLYHSGAETVRWTYH